MAQDVEQLAATVNRYRALLVRTTAPLIIAEQLYGGLGQMMRNTHLAQQCRAQAETYATLLDDILKELSNPLD